MLWLYAISDGALSDGADTDASDEPASPWGKGLEGDLFWVEHRGLVAVVEDLDESPAVTAETLQAHDRAVRRLADRLPALLPARFGQTAADRRALCDFLEAREAQWTESLRHVRGCVQLSVRLLAAESPSESPAESPPRPDEPAGEGRRYLRRRLDRYRVPGLEELKRHVEPWVRETRTRLGPAPVLASAYHLVARERLADLSASLRDFVLAHDVRIRVGEPTPAYAFTTLESPWAP